MPAADTFLFFFLLCHCCRVTCFPFTCLSAVVAADATNSDAISIMHIHMLNIYLFGEVVMLLPFFIDTMHMICVPQPVFVCIYVCFFIVTSPPTTAAATAQKCEHSENKESITSSSLQFARTLFRQLLNMDIRKKHFN